MNCIDCTKVATERIEDLDFCEEHYKKFIVSLDELEVKGDIYSEDSSFATD